MQKSREKARPAGFEPATGGLEGRNRFAFSSNNSARNVSSVPPATQGALFAEKQAAPANHADEEAFTKALRMHRGEIEGWTCTWEHVLATARDVHWTRRGGPWTRVLVHDMRPHLAEGFEEYERAEDLLWRAYGTIEEVVDRSDEHFGTRTPFMRAAIRFWGRIEGTEAYAFCGLFIRGNAVRAAAVHTWVSALQGLDLEVQKLPVQGCSAFDICAHADRPWPREVLNGDPTAGAWFRGRRGDLVESWLAKVFGYGARHAWELTQALCDAGFAADWVDSAHPLDALANAGWIIRGACEVQPSHLPNDGNGGTIRKQAGAKGTKLPTNEWVSLKFSRDYDAARNEFTNMHPSIFVWLPNYQNDDAMRFVSRAREAA